MSAGVLDQKGIVDMLYGENQQTELLDAGTDDGSCWCVCNCFNSLDRSTNNRATGAGTFAVAPAP